MRVDIVTIFPELFSAFVETSIVGRARSGGIMDIHVHDLREWTTDRHRSVDDYPYGGGGGMVMLAEPFFRFHDYLAEELGERPYVVMMSARGAPFVQRRAKELARRRQISLFCGHYKGIDARVDELVDEEISLGDFVLSGGEIPAMAVVDAVCRLLPGAVGDRASIEGDSFYDGPLLGPPEYTRPEEFRGMKVPDVLLSGNHAMIDAWRRERALELTRDRRPDLLRTDRGGSAPTAGGCCLDEEAPEGN